LLSIHKLDYLSDKVKTIDKMTVIKQ